MRLADKFPAGVFAPTIGGLRGRTGAMEDHEFVKLADAAMDGLMDRLSELDPDEVDADLAQGVLKMEFGSGGVCVMNRQTAAHQIWLAEGATAWHFGWDGERWMDTKERGALESVLEEILSRRLGRPVSLL